MSPTKIPAEIEQQAAYWYVRIRSPELTAEQESEFFAWLESSALHQVAFVRMEQAWTAGGAIRLRPPQKAFASTRKLGAWLSAAAAVLITVLLIHPYPVHQEETAPELEKYTAIAEQKNVTLPDQSSAILSPNSLVELRYSESARELHLSRGHIFLNVKQDAQRPFKVFTKQGVVRVIGTQFAVQHLAEDLKITVVEGLVGLLKSKSANSDQAPLLVLRKNQQILYSDALKGAVATTVDAARETSWTKGRMIFDGVPLAEVTATLNQHLSLPIQVASPDLLTKRIVGAISIKNPRVAAESLASIAGAVVEETPNKDALVLKSASDNFSEQ
jgi:transmembrane sensor